MGPLFSKEHNAYMMGSADEAEPEVRNNCTVCLNFDLPETLPSVVYLRKKARAMIESLDVARHDADDLELILGELATNVVRHANGGDYHVRIELHANHAVICVVDKGVGFSPDALSEPGSTRPDTLQDAFERIGGFGLPVVRSMADTVEIAANPANPAGGVSVRAAKTLQPKL